MSHRLRRLGRLLASGGVALWLAASALADDLPPEILALAKAARQFRQDAAVLSSFACLETIARSESDRKSGKLRQLDRVDLEVTKIGHQEWFSWPGGASFHDDPGDMVGHGMIGSGDFLAIAQSALATDSHPIAFVETTRLNGRKAYRFKYEISPFAAKYHVKTLVGEGDVGMRGDVWIDAGTADLLRVSAQGWQMPDYLGLELLETVISYQRIPVNQQLLLFPDTAQATMRYTGGNEMRNITGFSHCRTYEASSRLMAEGDSAAAPPPELRPLVALPPNLRIELDLRTPVDASMRVGAPIEAKLVGQIRLKGSRETVPRGAQVLGRVRRLRPCQNSKSCWEMGIEFDEIDTPDRRFRFVARFLAASPLAGLSTSLQSATQIDRDLMTGVQTTISTTTTTLIDLPGTVSFFLTTPPYRLPAGLQMTWTTTKPAAPK